MSFEKHISKAKTIFAKKPKQPPALPSKQLAKLSDPISCAYPLCVAKCSYTRSEVKELSFMRGDLFHIICDKHTWWFVHSQTTGTQGFIPSNYVIRLPHNEEIPEDKIQLVERVGEGRFSDVWRGKMYQVLSVTVKVSKPEYARQSLEAAQLFVLKHHNIVRLYGLCSVRVPMCIVLEYMKHGSLNTYLRGEGHSLTLSQLVSMAAQVASGMSYLEQHKYVHRELAAKNVLVRDNLVCKVANFELACFVKDENTILPSALDTSFKWMAPECLMYNQFTIKSDVWSFGIVLYETVTYGRAPYPGLTNSQVLELLQRGDRMSSPMHCPDKLYDIMLNCWKQVTENRPTFETLLWQLEEFFIA